MGLPAWLRRGEPGRVRSPSIFPLTKSRCFADDGTKTCVNPGHSCWRRVVDCSQVAWPRAWKAEARGTRGRLRNCQFIPRSVRFIASRGIQVHSDRCWKCGTPLHQMSVVVADIDQAFEACESSAVMPAFEFFRGKFLSLCMVSGSGCEKPRKMQQQPNHAQDKKVGGNSICNPCRKRSFSFAG